MITLVVVAVVVVVLDLALPNKPVTKDRQEGP